MLVIRTMNSGDVALGLKLCRLAEWNHIEADWRRVLTLSPGSAFVGEYKGRSCATACATPYGTRTAWIGMVLVHPEFRRRGISSALMNHCIDHLKSIRVESIKIDATDQGRTVYLKLGFDDERPVHCYWRAAGTVVPGTGTNGALGTDAQATGVRSARQPVNGPVRAIAPKDWPAIAECDLTAFQSDRLRLLKLLAEEGPAVLVEADGKIGGYGFARRGFYASHLGPIVAVDAATARQVVLALLAGLPEGEVHWNILPDNVACKQLASSLGFAVRRRFTRMCLGSQTNTGDLSILYGTAGLELG